MNKFMTFDATIKNAFNNNAEDYVAFNKLLVDSYKGEVDGYSAKEANDKIVEIFRKAIGCDENSTKAEIRKAIRRNQVQIYELIEETIQDALVSGWDSNPFFQEYVDVRNLALGDKNEFYIEDESVLSVMKVSGNHHDIIRQRLGAGDYQSIATYWYALKIYAEFERLLTGAEDWAKLVSKVSEAFDRYINEALYNAMIGAGANLGTQWLKTGAIGDATKETLRTLCMDVAMATGHEVVIMGTRAALAPVYALTNVSWASNDMKNQMHTTGRFGYWEGIRLVEIPQNFKLNDTTNYLVDNDKLFIMPVADNKFIKLVNEGDAQVFQIQDAGERRDMTYEYEYQMKMGIAVMTNLKWGMWSITA